MILSTIQTPTDSPTNCHRCSTRLVKTHATDFPSCLTCGWEDYSPAVTPVRLWRSTMESITDAPPSRFKGLSIQSRKR